MEGKRGRKGEAGGEAAEGAAAEGKRAGRERGGGERNVFTLCHS